MSRPSEEMIQDTNEINSIVKSILTRMQNDCTDSKNLLDSNIEDSMSKTIRKWIENPLASSIESHRSAEKTALINIENLIEFVFSKLYKDIIYKVYKDTNSYKDYNQYAVILKEDTIENRGMINYFIFLYNRSELRKRFPLIIQYIPKEFEDELINVKELSLSND
jgi:hypothetical protein